MSKHIINSPKTLVKDSLAGLVYLNPNLTLSGTTVSVRSPDPKRVHLICGGGSGHEPAHAGYVGEGMLTSAICGQVFASPNAGQVEQVLENLKSSEGILIIVKNYTGDVLHFGLATERWAATHLGENKVRMVVVGDDVAVPRSQGELTGRRGLAATVLVYKIAGALAKQGASLDEVEFIAQHVADNSATFGVSLQHVHVPGTEQTESAEDSDKSDKKADKKRKKEEKDETEQTEAQNQVELGMGIHNEPGIRKMSIPTAERLVDELLSTLTSSEDKERNFVPFKNDGKDDVILLVNNLGGLSELEMGGIVNECAKWLKAKHFNVQRAVAGTFMTSLNMQGFSISLVLLPRERVEPTGFTSKLSFDSQFILELFDEKTEAPGWKFAYKGKPEAHIEDEDEAHKKPKVEEASEDKAGLKPTNSKLFKEAIKAAMKRLIKAEPEITRYDTIGGDGDAGLTLRAGAEAIQEQLETLSTENVVAAIVEISAIVEKSMGGTSGGLYAIFLSGLAKGLTSAAKEKSSETATQEIWARGLELALNTLYQYTRARPPSRTLVDPLGAFIGNFAADPTAFDKAFKAAKEATEATKDFEAKAGRAAYVDQEKLAQAKVPDAGAFGVLQILEGVKEAMDAAQD